MSDKSEDFEKKFRKIKLESNATIHLNAERYRDALEVLRELKTLQSNDDVIAKTYFSTMECECYLHLEEYSAASEVIQNIEKTLTPTTVMPDDVVKMAKSCKDEVPHIRAYILYYVSCKLYIRKSANDAAGKIKSMFGDMKEMAEKMIKSSSTREVLSKHMLPCMKMVLEDLVGMPDNGNREKIEQETWCYYDIAYCYGYLGDNIQGITVNEAGIRLMKEKMGDDAEKYKITGRCYNNAGVAYFNLRNENSSRDREAKEAFKNAMRVLENAVDYTDENERQHDIDLSRENNRFDRLIYLLPFLKPKVSRM